MNEAGPPIDHDAEVGRILSEILDGRARGEPASLHQWISKYPQYAAEIREHIALLDQVLSIPKGASQSWPQIPGYQILGEIGRGGMGVVYEAYQLSTKRVIALKVEI